MHAKVSKLRVDQRSESRHCCFLKRCFAYALKLIAVVSQSVNQDHDNPNTFVLLRFDHRYNY